MMHTEAKIVNILGVQINSLSKSEALDFIEQIIEKNQKSIVCTPNTEFIVRAQKDQEFKTIINKKSKLNIPDGFGILWAAKFNSFKTPDTKIIRELTIFFQWISSLILIPFSPRYFQNPIKEKISGSDFVWPLSEMAKKNKYKIFLLGGASTVAERTALVMQTKIQGLNICGVHSGSPKDTEEIIRAVNKSKADILFVAFGSPKQEKWLADNISKTNCKIGIGVGGTFDFISGTRLRAPIWMQKCGLEWLFRLIIEPARINRQLSIPYFMWLVFINKIKTQR